MTQSRQADRKTIRAEFMAAGLNLHGDLQEGKLSGRFEGREKVIFGWARDRHQGANEERDGVLVSVESNPKRFHMTTDTGKFVGGLCLAIAKENDLRITDEEVELLTLSVRLAAHTGDDFFDEEFSWRRDQVEDEIQPRMNELVQVIQEQREAVVNG